MSVYLCIGDAAHKMYKLYVGIDGKARQVRKMYVGVNGQACLAYQSGTPLGNFAVGSTVKLKVNGADRDFIVVHQGKPSSVYDDSCNGTWLLMKDIYTKMKWNRSNRNNDYKNSDIHSYLNGTFYNLIESDIRSAIKQVKIPYHNGTGSGGSLATGSNGLSTKVFSLSGTEAGVVESSMDSTEGTKLPYFDSGSKRIAYNDGKASTWWLRSPYTSSKNSIWRIGTNGSGGYFYYDDSCGVRPCMILPPDTLVDETGHVIA